MNIQKYSRALFMAAILLVSACTDFVDPAIPYKDFDTGTYLRTVERTSTSFNFFDLSNSRFALTLEAVDIEDGATVDKVEIFVKHLRIVPGTGLVFTPTDYRLVKTIEDSEFQPNSASRFLRASFSITATETLTAVGLNTSQINGGDFFDYRVVLTTKSGRVFSDNNRSADVAGGFFYASPFFYRIPVVCPSSLGGTFQFKTTNISAGAGGNAGACGGEATGTVTIAAVANTTGVYTVSDVSFGVFGCAWSDTPPAGSVRLNDACGALSFSGSDKYGDAYTFTFVSNTGTELTFDWVNTYGDGGRTVLTAPAGFTFPATLR